ncbi:MAG: histidine phosphatase family protein [Exilibacterium sp.]
MSIIDIDSTTQVDLLRHGECKSGGTFNGITDTELSPVGMETMQRRCEVVAGQWDLIMSSPLKRCLHFANHFGGELDIPVVMDSRLREMSFGDWEGRKTEQVWLHDEARVAAWTLDPSKTTPPNGESLYKVSERLADFYDYVLGHYGGKKLLIVTHGGVIRLLLTRVLGMPLSHANRFDVPHGSMSRINVFHSATGDITKLLLHDFWHRA